MIALCTPTLYPVNRRLTKSARTGTGWSDAAAAEEEPVGDAPPLSYRLPAARSRSSDWAESGFERRLSAFAADYDVRAFNCAAAAGEIVQIDGKIDLVRIINREENIIYLALFSLILI